MTAIAPMLLVPALPGAVPVAGPAEGGLPFSAFLFAAVEASPSLPEPTPELTGGAAIAGAWRLVSPRVPPAPECVQAELPLTREAQETSAGAAVIVMVATGIEPPPRDQGIEKMPADPCMPVPRELPPETNLPDDVPGALVAAVQLIEAAISWRPAPTVDTAERSPELPADRKASAPPTPEPDLKPVHDAVPADLPVPGGFGQDASPLLPPTAPPVPRGETAARRPSTPPPADSAGAHSRADCFKGEEVAPDIGALPRSERGLASDGSMSQLLRAPDAAPVAPHNAPIPAGAMVAPPVRSNAGAAPAEPERSEPMLLQTSVPAAPLPRRPASRPSVASTERRVSSRAESIVSGGEDTAGPETAVSSPPPSRHSLGLTASIESIASSALPQESAERLLTLMADPGTPVRLEAAIREAAPQPIAALLQDKGVAPAVLPPPLPSDLDGSAEVPTASLSSSAAPAPAPAAPPRGNASPAPAIYSSTSTLPPEPGQAELAGPSAPIDLVLGGDGDRGPRIRVELRDGAVRARILHPDSAIANDLQRDIPQLRAALAEQGFPEARIAVRAIPVGPNEPSAFVESRALPAAILTTGDRTARLPSDAPDQQRTAREDTPPRDQRERKGSLNDRPRRGRRQEA